MKNTPARRYRPAATVLAVTLLGSSCATTRPAPEPSPDLEARAATALKTAEASGRPAAPADQDERTPYTPAQLARAVTITELALSPSGDALAVVTDRSGVLELWTGPVGDTASSSPAVLTQRTHAGENIAWPTWSPDGSSLLFSMDHGGDERYDLWRFRRDATQPERLFESSSSETQARHSPDGRFIAYLADGDRAFRFNLWLLELRTGKRRQLTREEVSLTDPRFSPDGRTLVATRTPDDQKGDLLVIDVATGTTRVIAPPRQDGMLRPVDFLPDGRLVALATNTAGFLQLAVVDLAAGGASTSARGASTSDRGASTSDRGARTSDREARASEEASRTSERELPAGPVSFVGPGDWDVEHAAVAADGAVVYVRNVHGESEVAIAPGPALFSSPARRLATGGVLTGLAIDRRGQSILVLRERSNSPAEVIALEPARGAERTVIAPELGEVRVEALARAGRRAIHASDGLEIDTYVWKPTSRVLGTPPPAVLLIHGGPDSQTRPGFDPLALTLAEAGVLVVSPNYRGSSGYGQAFLDLNNKDWGGGDLRDLLAAVDTLAAAGELDPERVAVMGESFGGYLTLRAMTVAPERWRAGIDLYGMSDLVEDYHITEDRYGPWYRTEMGDPKTDEALFRERSPIHAIERIRAPLLVFQGANDTDVPKAESDLVVQRMRDLRLPVEYVVYPDEGHGFTRRENRTDMMQRSVEFLVRHLAPRLPAPASPSRQ